MIISNFFSMKIKLCFSFFFIILATISFAQVSQETINKSKNYVNYKLTNYCLEKFISSKDGGKSKPIYDSIKTNLLLKSLEDSFDFTTLSSQLSNRFEKVKDKLSANIDKIDFGVFSGMKNEDIANIIVGKSIEVYNEHYEARFPLKKDSLKLLLEKEVLGFLNNNTSKVESKKNDGIKTNQNTDDTVKVDDEKSVKELGFFSLADFNFWNLLTLLLLGGSLLFTLSRISNLNDRIDEMKRGKMSNDGINIHSNNNNSSSQFDINRISMLEKSILNLSNKIEKIGSMKIFNKEDEKQLNKKIVEEELQKASDNIFYMMKPVDNYFPNSGKSFNKSDTVYKFTLSKNQTEAQFEIHIDKTTVNDIAKRNEQYLKPACNEENVPSNEVKNIVTISKGLVSLEGDKWVIKTKAVIKYE
jgi:hypothetical protein